MMDQRLVDANKVIIEANSLKIWHNNNGHKKLLTPNELLGCIKNAETVYTLPVVFADWEQKYLFKVDTFGSQTIRWHECTNCGVKPNVTDDCYRKEVLSPYCHNCGAIMSIGDDLLATNVK